MYMYTNSLGDDADQKTVGIDAFPAYWVTCTCIDVYLHVFVHVLYGKMYTYVLAFSVLYV